MGMEFLEGRFCVNGPMVVSETLDNESIILHHGTGKYFSTKGTGAVIWEGIENGLDVPSLAMRLKDATGADTHRSTSAVLEFIHVLRSHELIQEEQSSAPAKRLAVPPAIPFENPLIEVHDDLADMLLLDPIHDVSEEGWPSAKSAA